VVSRASEATLRLPPTLSSTWLGDFMQNFSTLIFKNREHLEQLPDLFEIRMSNWAVREA
jgi:hypothetical protein